VTRAAAQVVGLGEVTPQEGGGTQLPSRRQTPEESDALALAKCYFDAREFRRAAHALAGHATPPPPLVLSGHAASFTPY
jgi:hypothetical protein